MTLGELLFSKFLLLIVAGDLHSMNNIQHRLHWLFLPSFVLKKWLNNSYSNPPKKVTQ